MDFGMKLTKQRKESATWAGHFSPLEPSYG
uniref:Uncharacterized protein n=1 Tax=Nymphaea colorata TaxID=210225 RepID=A0A5K0VPJ6_9MAGN